jgi:indolepyruvate ferredoxin oxidoreductase
MIRRNWLAPRGLMARTGVTLADKFDLTKDRVLLSGSQAIVRLALTQKDRDRRAGLRTAGFISGYRGSPLGGLDQQFWRAKRELEASEVTFTPGLNEDLAATAVWGSQQAELRGEGRYDGVFGLWYGKGPGVDRTGDVFRHANFDGTSKHGGVIALMGDDHTCESSTTAHQSEFAFVDAMMPILNPAGVQEILDYGQVGWALSRFSGLWVGLKCIKDSIESTAVVDGSLDRVRLVLPDFEAPPGGLNIRTRNALEKEELLHRWKKPAALTFIRENGLEPHRHARRRKARLGIVSLGKSWLDTLEALDLLGIDERRAADLGLRSTRWPPPGRWSRTGVKRFADGLETISSWKKSARWSRRRSRSSSTACADAPTVIGKKDEQNRVLLPAWGALEANQIAGHPRPQNPRLRQGLGDRGAPETPGARARRAADHRGHRRAHPAFLLRLPAQHLDKGAGRQPRLCRHRLPLHGAVDGPRHRGFYPDGRRGGQLDRRGAVLHPRPRLPEPRRRHLQPFRRSGHARRQGRRRQHHLQDPLQRRRRHDRRSAGRGGLSVDAIARQVAAEGAEKIALVSTTRTATRQACNGRPA